MCYPGSGAYLHTFGRSGSIGTLHTYEAGRAAVSCAGADERESRAASRVGGGSAPVEGGSGVSFVRFNKKGMFR
jgi:hypothetical protein